MRQFHALLPTLLLAAVGVLVVVGCSSSNGKDPIKEYKDEDLQRNPLKQETNLQFDEIPGVNMRLPAGWHLPEKARTDRWVFDATPYAGEPASMRLDIEYDEKYQLNADDIDQKHYTELRAWQAAADIHGTGSFRVLVERLIKVHPVGGKGIIPGWMCIYVDREDPVNNTGPLRVRMVCKLWEKSRAFSFFMATTMSGYEQVFGKMFQQMVESFRSKRALGME
ncbi:MAG: hypothetical protein AB7K09_24105 [Planctomycetota bacterium]